MNNKYQLIDLFAGSGAFSLIFNKYGIKTFYANDFDKNCKIIFDNNIKDCKLDLNDIKDIKINYNINNNYILTAGFNCQPFSIAGKQLGLNDKRAYVYDKTFDIIKEIKPKIVIIENVKNLLTHNKGNSFKYMIDNLTKLNYFIKYKILDTAKYSNIPQHRERLFIIGFLNKEFYDKFNFNYNVINNNNIIDYLENNVDDKYYYTEKSKIYNILKDNIKENIINNIVYQYRRKIIRKNKSNLCPTLTANMGEGGHNVPIILDNKGIRKLTPRECFNLQGFNNNYILNNLSDTALYKIAGNGVSLPIIELIINKLVNIINNNIDDNTNINNI